MHGDALLLTPGGVAIAGPTLQPYAQETGFWRCETIAEKWSEEFCQWVRRKLGIPEGEGLRSDLLKMFREAEVIDERHGNLLLNEGIQKVWDLAIGATTTNKYDNATAQLGVGDSSTAAAATQTDLQAASNKLFKAMNATFPSRSAQTVTFASDFLTGEANFSWQEWSIRNGATDDKNLNRAVQNLGTKASGTWTLTVTVTIS